MLARPNMFSTKKLASIAGLVCSASFALYLCCSLVMRQTVAGLGYHHALANMFLSGHAPLIVQVPVWRDLSQVIAFILLCLAGGLLASRFAGQGDRCPYVIVFALALTIAPSMSLVFRYWPDGQGHLTTPNILRLTLALDAVIAICVILVPRGRRRPPVDKIEELPRKSEGRMWAIILTCFGALVYFAAVLNGIAAPLQGYDSTAYHLPLAATFLRQSSFVTGLNPQMFYPANCEYLERWALTIGTDQFVCLVSWLMALLCGYAIYAICRLLGRTRTAALVAAISSIVSSPIAFLASSAYIDLYTTACFLLSVLFFLRWYQSEHPSFMDVVAFGAAAGLALGSKYSVIPSLIVLGAVWLVVLIAKSVLYPDNNGRDELASKRMRRRFALSLSLMAASALMCGGFWYLRNLAATGSPVYPIATLGFKGMPLDQLTQVTPILKNPSWRWVTYPWTENGYASRFDDGFGLLFPILVLPALILYPWARRGRANRKGSLLLYVSTLSLWLIFFQSGLYYPRYALLPLVLSFVFIGEFWDAVPHLRLRLPVVLAVILAAAISAEEMTAGVLYACVIQYTTLRGGVRGGVPGEIDDLPPSRIFNVAGKPYAYSLMGKDYRHTVLTSYFPPTPKEVAAQNPEYLLLLTSQVDEFSRVFPLRHIGAYPANGTPIVSLWKVQQGAAPLRERPE